MYDPEYATKWRDEADLHSTWDAVVRDFPDEMNRIIQRELDAMEAAMPDLRSEWQHIVLLFEEHPS